MRKLYFGIGIAFLVMMLTGCSIVSSVLGKNPPCGYENLRNGHAYCLTPEGKSWQEAQDYAKQFDGHLVVINDQHEQQWLIQAFGEDWYWIGLTDENQEGAWQWVNGETLRYSNWQDGEPNDQWDCGEDYAMMNWNSGGTWNDLGPCSPEWGSVSQGIVEVPLY